MSRSGAILLFETDGYRRKTPNVVWFCLISSERHILCQRKYYCNLLYFFVDPCICNQQLSEECDRIKESECYRFRLYRSMGMMGTTVPYLKKWPSSRDGNEFSKSSEIGSEFWDPS